MNFLELAKSRYSCRSMDADHQVEKEKITSLLEAARLAPTGSNLQRHRIRVVRSKEGLEKMRSCTPCHYNAPVVLILTFELEMKGLGMEVPEELEREVGNIDIGIVAAHICLQAKEQGLETVIAGSFDEKKLREAFQIPDSQETALIIPVGYADEKGKTPDPLHEKSISLEEMAQWI